MSKLARLRSDLGRLAANVHAGVRSLQLDIDRMDGGAGDSTSAPADAEARTLDERVSDLERKYPLLEDGVRIALTQFREWVQAQFASIVFAPGVQRTEAPSAELTPAQMDPEVEANLKEVRAMRLAGLGQHSAEASNDGEKPEPLAIEAQDAGDAEPGAVIDQRSLDDIRAARVAGIAAESPEEEQAPVTPRDGSAGDTPDGGNA